MELLELHDVCKTYHLGEMDLQVLKGVTLSVAKGELVALMGASGSGKSTLMNILGCLDHASSGRVLAGWTGNFDRLTQRTRPPAQSPDWICFSKFQPPGPHFRAGQCLHAVDLRLHYLHEDEMKARAREMLQKVGLADRMHHQPSQLSGGQQQRVAIARSLINRPRLLLADEPTGNLDSRTSEEILQMFRDLNEKEGLTIILVTHDPEVAHHAKRVIRIRDGLIESGSRRPRSEEIAK